MTYPPFLSGGSSLPSSSSHICLSAPPPCVQTTDKYLVFILICPPHSSCPGRTVRTAPSTVSPATGVPTQTRPCTRPWPRLSVRVPLPHPPLSLCQVCRTRTPWQTGPSRGNRTPLRSGPSPGACMKVGVSILFSGGGWMRAAWGSLETFGVFNGDRAFSRRMWDNGMGACACK